MSRWFENQRIAFIAEMLHIYGFINREHLIRKFGISTPQASKGNYILDSLLNLR